MYTKVIWFMFWFGLLSVAAYVTAGLDISWLFIGFLLMAPYVVDKTGAGYGRK